MNLEGLLTILVVFISLKLMGFSFFRPIVCSRCQKIEKEMTCDMNKENDTESEDDFEKIPNTEENSSETDEKISKTDEKISKTDEKISKTDEKIPETDEKIPETENQTKQKSNKQKELDNLINELVK